MSESVRWYVPCGCDGHGDHLACQPGCADFGCVHPVGVEVSANTEADANALADKPLPAPLLRLIKTGKIHKITIGPADPGSSAEAPMHDIPVSPDMPRPTPIPFTDEQLRAIYERIERIDRHFAGCCAFQQDTCRWATEYNELYGRLHLAGLPRVRTPIDRRGFEPCASDNPCDHCDED